MGNEMPWPWPPPCTFRVLQVGLNPAEQIPACPSDTILDKQPGKLAAPQSVQVDAQPPGKPPVHFSSIRSNLSPNLRGEQGLTYFYLSNRIEMNT